MSDPVVRWREGGIHRQKTLKGATKAEARKYKRMKESQAWRAELGGLNDRRTLAEFLEEFWQKRPPKAENTRRSYEVCIRKHIRPALGGYRLIELTVPRIEGFREQLERQGVGAPQIRKTLSVLQGALNVAVLWGYLDKNPVPAVPKPPTPRTKRIQPVPVETIESIRAESELGHATLVSLLAYSGMRPQEALALTWADIGERTITVDKALAFGQEKQTKTNRTRSVALLSPLAADLRQWRLASPPSPLLFPRRLDRAAWQAHDYSNWRRRFFKRRFDGATPYYLRHTFATLLLYAGYPVHHVARQLGHSPSVCLDTYSHVLDEWDPESRIDPETTILNARGLLAENVEAI